MSRFYLSNNTTQAVGNTPLVKLNHITKDLDATIAVKLEYCNPTASVKDRAASWIIKEAEERGDIIPGKSVLIEGTSGNTGIALAALAAIKGYKCIIVMPSSMSIERRAVLKAYGALIVLTDPIEGMDGIQQRVDDLADMIPYSYKTNQFGNASNPKAHYHGTGPEIWEQTDGKVDLVVFGVGTGGTVTGVGRFLREKKPEVGIYAVEPFESSVLSGLPRGLHKIQGIGAGVVPEILDQKQIQEILRIKSDDAVEMARRLAQEEGIMGGISSGANVCAAIEVTACFPFEYESQLAKRPENKGKLIVTSVNSYGERYLSSALYDEVRSQVEEISHEDLETSQKNVREYLGV